MKKRLLKATLIILGFTLLIPCLIIGFVSWIFFGDSGAVIAELPFALMFQED